MPIDQLQILQCTGHSCPGMPGPARVAFRVANEIYGVAYALHTQILILIYGVHREDSHDHEPQSESV